MNLGKMAQIARREYLARVRSKAFIITTLLFPGLIVVFAGLAPLMTRADVDVLRVTVVDAGTGLGETLATRLEGEEDLPLELQRTIQTSPAEVEQVRAGLSDAIRADELDGYLVLRPEPETLARASYYARETSNIVVLATLERAVTRTILENWFSGEDLERIRRVQGVDLGAVRVSAEGEEAGGFEIAYFSTYILGMLLYMAVLIQGQQMATSIVEEKSSRLVELIIGAVTAQEYMVGKITGVLGSGLTQLGIWLGCGLVATLYVLPGLAMASVAGGFEWSQVLGLELVFYLVLFFVLGYVMYTTLYAAVGATCSSTEELQHAIMPVMLPVMFAFFAMFYVTFNPSSPASRALSFFPLFTPLTMFARINVAQPPAWEIWTGVALLVGFTLLCVWAAAKIFRVAILMHGKRPSLPEIFRMVRAA